jgi:hypothetical protein
MARRGWATGGAADAYRRAGGPSSVDIAQGSVASRTWKRYHLADPGIGLCLQQEPAPTTVWVGLSTRWCSWHGDRWFAGDSIGRYVRHSAVHANKILVDNDVGVAVPLAMTPQVAGSANAGSSTTAGSSVGGGSGAGSPNQVTPTGGSRVGTVIGMAGGSAGMLAASVLGVLATKAGEEAITTAGQVRKFAFEYVAGPATKRLSEGLAQGLADKANSLWGTNRQAKENAADRARIEVRQQLTVLLNNGLAQGKLATVVPEDQRAAIAEAIADELAERLAIQMRARIHTGPSNTKPFTG